MRIAWGIHANSLVRSLAYSKDQKHYITYMNYYILSWSILHQVLINTYQLRGVTCPVPGVFCLPLDLSYWRISYKRIRQERCHAKEGSGSGLDLPSSSSQCLFLAKEPRTDVDKIWQNLNFTKFAYNICFWKSLEVPSSCWRCVCSVARGVVISGYFWNHQWWSCCALRLFRLVLCAAIWPVLRYQQPLVTLFVIQGTLAICNLSSISKKIVSPDQTSLTQLARRSILINLTQLDQASWPMVSTSTPFISPISRLSMVNFSSQHAIKHH